MPSDPTPREASPAPAASVTAAGENAGSSPEGSGAVPVASKPVSGEEPPAEAVSLWLLNRPKTDLVAKTPEPPEPTAAAVAAVTPVMAVVVLGIGPAQACADGFAQLALRYLLEGREPRQVVSSLLEQLRRSRWPATERSSSATLRGSDGSFGALQSAAPDVFSSELLERAWSRHDIIDGENPRVARAAAAPPDRTRAASGSSVAAAPTVPGCELPGGTELRGPSAVMLRSGPGAFFAGLVDLDPPVDAGVVPSVSQYGVSVAVGGTGAVVLISDCAVVPDEALAERVYTRLERGTSQELPTDATCARAHVVLADQGARALGSTPLAWASATPTQPRQPTPEPPPAQPGSPAPPPSADAGAPEPTRPP